MKYLLISFAPAFGSFFAGGVLAASEVPHESFVTNLFNYGGIGVALAFCFYLLREQAKDNKDQLKNVTQQFTDSLEKERVNCSNQNQKLCDRVQIDHDRCKLDHIGMSEKISNLQNKLEMIHEVVKKPKNRDDEKD